MNQTAAYAYESQFGPPSEFISIKDFLRECEDLHPQTYLPRVNDGPIASTSSTANFPQDWILSPEEEAAIEAECSVEDIKESLNHVLSTPALYAHLVGRHESAIEAALETANPGKAKKKKRKADAISDETSESPEVTKFRETLDNIQLSCWSYPPATAAFVRGTKNSDFNALDARPLFSRKGKGNAAKCGSPKYPDAVLTFSVYDRLSWGNFLSRSSQHMVLASQTLGDMYKAIFCRSNEIPEAVVADGKVLRYEEGTARQRGAVLCIEGVAYGDGQNEEDYSDKLLKQMEKLPRIRQRPLVKGKSMHEQLISDLSLRINQAYWLLHQGFCEHFVVIEQIRLIHPSDQDKVFPVTLSIAPPNVDICQACSKLPSAWSILNDIRLEQTPALLCGPCGEKMGMPEGQNDIVVVPLPKYELGWPK